MIHDAGARRFVWWTGAALGLLAFAWLFPGLGNVGIAWDEPLLLRFHPVAYRSGPPAS